MPVLFFLHPACVLGGKCSYDDLQSPDTQTVIFEYDLDGGRRKQLVYE